MSSSLRPRLDQVVGSRACGAVRVAREVVEEADRQVPQLRAAQTTDDGPDVLIDQVGSCGDVVDGSIKEVGNALLQKLITFRISMIAL